MPLYRYKAVSTAGELSSGELDAANEAEIVDRLRDQGLMPMQVVASTGSGSGNAAVARAAAPAKPARQSMFASKKVSQDQLLSITRELATLLRAGLPLDRALETLIALTGSRPVAQLLQGVRDDVRGGKALSQA